MADIWSTAKRSAMMSKVRTKNTTPELKVRLFLHKQGFRFTVNSRKNRELPGKPDIILPRWKTIIFVHGCFWHFHEGCPAAKLPKTRREWWLKKLESNRARDTNIAETLEKMGWQVIVVWECEIRNRTVSAEKHLEIVRAIKS